MVMIPTNSTVKITHPTHSVDLIIGPIQNRVLRSQKQSSFMFRKRVIHKEITENLSGYMLGVTTFKLHGAVCP